MVLSLFFPGICAILVAAKENVTVFGKGEGFYGLARDMERLPPGAGELRGDLVLAALIFLGGWLLARLAARLTKKAISKGKVDALAASFFGSLVKAVVLVVAGVSAVAQLGVNINSLVAALGAAGLTASFALQGSLSNLVSGIQIIFTKPFNMGTTSPLAPTRAR